MHPKDLFDFLSSCPPDAKCHISVAGKWRYNSTIASLRDILLGDGPFDPDERLTLHGRTSFLIRERDGVVEIDAR